MPPTVHKLKLSALRELYQATDQAFDLESALGTVLRIMHEQLSMQHAIVALRSPQTEQFSIIASHGQHTEIHSADQLKKTMAERIFRSDEPFIIPTSGSEALFLNTTDTRMIHRKTVASIGVPIVLHEAPFGVLTVDRVFEDEIAIEEDMDFLATIASLIAQLISLNGKVQERENRLRRENTSLKLQKIRTSKRPLIVGDSTVMHEILRQIKTAAPTEATVLLLGESGVGKSLIARTIHDLSERNNHTFVKVNLASIPTDMVESKLFGHENDPGRLEEAHGGTIFLDGIDELSLSLQAKLLQVLKEKKLKRCANSHMRTANVRILTASNRDLNDMVEHGQFRLDLFYRLNVFPLHVPSLRNRKEDIPHLLSHFLSLTSKEHGRVISLTPSALDALIRYDWPGNVREMKNLITQLFILSDSERVTLECLKTYLTPTQAAEVHEAMQPGDAPPRITSLKDFERNEIVAALERADWLQYKAAEALSLTPRQMGYRVRKFGLEDLIAEGRALLRQTKEV